MHVAYIWSLSPRSSPEFVYSTHYGSQAEDAWQTLDDQVRTIEAAGGVVAETHLKLGVPERKAAELGEEVRADMVIVGSRKQGFIRRLFSGGEAERIACRVPCSVLVVRQECPQLPEA